MESSSSSSSSSAPVADGEPGTGSTPQPNRTLSFTVSNADGSESITTSLEAKDVTPATLAVLMSAPPSFAAPSIDTGTIPTVTVEQAKKKASTPAGIPDELPSKGKIPKKKPTTAKSRSTSWLARVGDVHTQIKVLENEGEKMFAEYLTLSRQYPNPLIPPPAEVQQQRDEILAALQRLNSEKSNLLLLVPLLTTATLAPPAASTDDLKQGSSTIGSIPTQGQTAPASTSPSFNTRIDIKQYMRPPKDLSPHAPDMMRQYLDTLQTQLVAQNMKPTLYANCVLALLSHLSTLVDFLRPLCNKPIADWSIFAANMVATYCPRSATSALRAYKDLKQNEG